MDTDLKFFAVGAGFTPNGLEHGLFVDADLMQRSLDLVKENAEQGPGCEVTQRMPITPE